MGETGKVSLTIDVHADVLDEIDYIIKLAKRDDQDIYFRDISGLVNYLFTTIADGARKPRSWEREVNNHLEIYMAAAEFEIYRAEYGDPDLIEF